MDYKYINQLLERYWRCETSLEEEGILRAFFSQAEIPAELRRYRALFVYEERQKQVDVLGEDFDARIMKLVEKEEPVKARTIRITQRLRPLFKAAAMVAIVLTIGNAAQVPFSDSQEDGIMSQYDGYSMPEMERTNPMAMGDSMVVDTMKQSLAEPKISSKDLLIK